MTGRVVLVGAGPGDPDLITVKGARALAGADVVVYDRLAAPALLEMAPAGAERVYVGKTPATLIVGEVAAIPGTARALAVELSTTASS